MTKLLRWQYLKASRHFANSYKVTQHAVSQRTPSKSRPILDKRLVLIQCAWLIIMRLYQGSDGTALYCKSGIKTHVATTYAQANITSLCQLSVITFSSNALFLPIPSLDISPDRTLSLPAQPTHTICRQYTISLALRLRTHHTVRHQRPTLTVGSPHLLHTHNRMKLVPRLRLHLTTKKTTSL